MAGPVLRACKNCMFIEEQTNEWKAKGYTCYRCGGETTTEWQGLLAVVDFEKSEIAKRMGISENGRYALRVR
jgi:DNA-directed RNA polymerase subunit E"